MNDLKFAFRQLLKHPGFTAAAVLTLAFGIGVNTSLFSLVSAIFFEPLPVQDADRLVLVLQRSDAWKLPHGHSWPDYRDYRERSRSFTDLIAYLPTPVHLSAAGQAPERTWIELVSPNYFSLVGVHAAHGRMFQAGEGETKGSAPVVVLSHRYWQRRFGGDESIVGKTITLNGGGFTVIGVAPASFQGVQWAMAVSGWVPAGMVSSIVESGESILEERGAPMWRIMGKLKPDSTLATARSEVDVIAQQLARDFPKQHEGARAMVIPESRARPDPTFADFLPVFAVVFTGMVCLVLFIACANVANLMLARSLTRQKELVVRSALGASRWRLIRQLLVESVLLAAIAGVLGIFLARLSDQAMSGFTPSGDMPINSDHPWQWQVYAFTALVSLVAGIATGVVPALKASRFELSESLKESGGGRVAGGRHLFRNFLVVGQVTLSLVVLICAGLFLHSLQHVKRVALGFRPENLLMLSLDLGLQRYTDERGKGFHRELLEKIRALPGVNAASLTQHVPFDYGIQIRDVAPENPPADFKDGATPLAFSRVDHTFLKTLGATLLRGRDLASTDIESAPRVAVINEAMAKHCWPGQEALGKRFRFGREGPWIEVVGIAANGKYVMLAEETRPYFYFPIAQDYSSPVTLVIRTAGAPAGFVSPMREAVRSLDPHLPVFNVRTMDEHLRTSAFALMPMRLGATMAGVQGGLGLLLAIMGLYAVVSYGVNQRTQEIGIRMALGARRHDVLRLVLREGLRLTLAGLVVGLVLALGIGFILSHVLYGLNRMDVTVVLGTTALLLATTGLACYFPARRATKVHPMEALRYE